MIVETDGDGLLVALVLVGGVGLPVADSATEVAVDGFGAGDTLIALEASGVVGAALGVELHAETASMMAAAVAGTAREIGE